MKRLTIGLLACLFLSGAGCWGTKEKFFDDDLLENHDSKKASESQSLKSVDPGESTPKSKPLARLTPDEVTEDNAHAKAQQFFDELSSEQRKIKGSERSTADRGSVIDRDR